MTRVRIKKALLLTIGTAAAIAMAIFMSGCTDPQAEIPEENVDYEIALVTDDSLIRDGGHSQVAWNTITEFGATNGISHKYYKATEPTKAAFTETIVNAINNGGKIVIVDNSTMEDTVYKMQEKYPEIDFVLIHANPYEPETGDIKIQSNTAVLSFDSGQAGYLAGYAAVVEGYTQLGFLGENKSREIKGFGYGFVRGANAACRQLGTEASIKYFYCGDKDSEGVCRKAMNMYRNGTEVIFAAGATVQVPVIAAAEAENGKVIGSHPDQSGKSDTVITSAIYNINGALKNLLKDYKDQNFPGGEILVYNARNDGIGLEVKNNRLNNLTQSQYKDVYKALANRKAIINPDRVKNVREINAPYVVIE